MASTEELLRDAQHAFQNISPGATNEKKYRARARKLAQQVIRRNPQSSEAQQANTILRSLGDRTALSESMLTRKSHTRHVHAETWRASHQTHSPAEKPTRQEVVKKLAAVTEAFRQQRQADASPDEASWKDIWQAFSSLSYSKKKVVVFVLFFALIFIGNLPFLLFAFVFYAFRPNLIRRHIYSVLNALA